MLDDSDSNPDDLYRWRIPGSDGAHWTISFLEGVQYTVNPEKPLRWGVAVSPSLGRDADGDSPLRILGDDTDDSIGLGDTESTVSLRLFTQYKAGPWSMNAHLQQTFTDETQSLFSTGIRRSGRIRAMGRPLIVSAGIRLRAGDQPTLATLVGVTPEESKQSALENYRPDSGLIAVGINGIFGFIRPWYRLPEVAKETPNNPKGDDNPDILDYMGHGELLLGWRGPRYAFSAELRNNFSTGKGAAELSMSFPLFGRFCGVLQYCNGYGDALID